MDISIYFQPIVNYQKNSFKTDELGAFIKVNSEIEGFPDMQEVKVAIIGVEEDRVSVNNAGSAKAPDTIRRQLYLLKKQNINFSIADLGNIKAGNEIKDTYFALSNCVSDLIKENIVPIIIGGGHDLTYANYTAYEKLEQTVNICTIDSKFDIGDINDDLTSTAFLSKIILHQPNFLFNYSNIGYQTYFVAKEEIKLISKLFFDALRLGDISRNQVSEVEPLIRNADLLSFDISSIKFSDAPASASVGPNGITGEDACQISRYAGYSDKLTSIGFYELNPKHDVRNQTAMLVGQMIWCFLDGFANRKNDFPLTNKKGYTKYSVFLEEDKYELIFLKSLKTDRWWMEVPYPTSKKIKFERHHLIPCSYKDYEAALNNEMPNKWWKTYQKLI